MAINNGLKWSAIAGGASLVLCLGCMLAGGLTWGTGAAGWLVFFALVLSAVVGFTAWNLINLHNKQDWLADRRSVYDRMQDAQACIKAEERAHERTKAELTSAKRQITQEHAEAQRYLKQYNEAKDAQEAMRIRCGQRDGVIKELRAELEEIRNQIQTDNDTWRQQVSNMREAAYKLAVHIEGSANGLPDEWEAWGAELVQDLRALAGAGGVQADERQIPIEGTTTVEAEIEAVAVAPIEPVSPDAWATPAETLDAMQVTAFQRLPLPAAPTGPNSIEELQAEVIDSIESVRMATRGIDAPEPVAEPSQWQELTRLMSQVRENQAQRRADLDVITKAVENGYELSQPFQAAVSKGMVWVTDQIIANERRYIEHSQPSE